MLKWSRLSFVLLLVTCIQVFVLAQSPIPGASFFKEADSFFKKYVTDGTVNYGSLYKDPTDLLELLKVVDTADLSDLDSESKKAFLINAYNLTVIKSVVLQYPLPSPNIPGFFDKELHKVAGSYLSLNDLENKMLLDVYNDPRIHFVLVCAAKSCPPITNYSYKPEILETQLDQQTKLALNNPEFIKVNSDSKKVEISSIFEWYRSDFASTNKELLEYINGYRTSKIPSNYKIGYYTYNWALNETSESLSSNISGSGNSTTISSNTSIPRYTTSALLTKGQIEYKMFNNLYTQKQNDIRSSYFTVFNQFLFGINPQLNIGFDVKLRTVNGSSTPANLFHVFKGSDENFRGGITGIGPKIKFAPFKTKGFNFSVQSTVLLPVLENAQGIYPPDGNPAIAEPFIDFDGVSWWTQMYYDRLFGTQWSLFFATNIFVDNFQLNQKDQINVAIPLSTIVSYFPTPKTTIYWLGEFAPRPTSENFDFYLQTGIAGKYEFLPGIEIELLYSIFGTKDFIDNGGSASTLNLGLRITR